jgi:NOL1/NOP2/fmu family ribosome biogenesis protein
MGVRALTRDPRFGERPTNDVLSWLDGDVRDHVVELDAPGCRELLEGETPEVDDVPDGNAALRMEGHVLGRGVVEDGELRHEIPKARARRLAEILERGADG